MLVADCLPVLLATPDGRAVAGRHAGWPGLAVHRNAGRPILAAAAILLAFLEAGRLALRSDGLELADPDGFRLATYGQLYSLKPRLNELMLKV